MYRLIREKKEFEGKGIEVCGIKYNEKFYGISTDKEFAQNVVDKFNRKNLSHEHFLECLYDEIIDEGFLLHKYLL